MKDSPEPNIEELKPDVRNANRGTERGREMLRESIRRFGMGRSILLDRNGNVIAGNKTLEAAKAEDIEALTVIETDGSRLIAVKRTDLSIDDARARELAIADNRTSETGLLWDEQEIQRLIDEGADLETFFPELYEAEPEAIEPENAEPKKMHGNRKYNGSETVMLARGYAMEGLIDTEIAARLGIGKTTYYRWLNEFPELREAVKRGKESTDFAVEQALLKKALKGDVTAQIFWLKNRKPRFWRDKPNPETAVQDDPVEKLLAALELSDPLSELESEP